MSRPAPKIEQVIDGLPVTEHRVMPIARDGVTYTISSQFRDKNTLDAVPGQDCYVEAKRDDGTILWKTKYASYDFVPMLETDVQMKLPVDFFFHENGHELVIKHEHYTENDRIFRIMIADGGEKLKSSS